MKTVLVTGSEGNIGQYLVAALARRDPSCKIVRVKNGSGPPRYDAAHQFYVGDLRDVGLLEAIFREHDVDDVIHAASTSYSHSGYRGHPFTVLHNDCSMSLNVLRFASRVRKVVFLSSALAYEHADATSLTEDLTSSLPAPTSSYGVAKYLGEQALLRAHEESGTTYTIWRPFNIVSPLEPAEGTGRHVFVDFFRRLFIERVDEFEVFGSGRQVRCFMWVEEAAECIVAALENSATDNQTINLARDEAITLAELKELMLSIGKEIGRLPPGYEPPTRPSGLFAGVESEIRIPSTRKLKQLTGWQSDIPIRECMRRFIVAKLEAGPVAGWHA